MTIRNHNPGNVKQDPKNPWLGSTGMDERGHAIFSSEALGWRAFYRTLAAKWLAGKRTLRHIVESWAPASDTIGSIPGSPPNDPERYARFVARETSLPHDARLDLFDERGYPLDDTAILDIARAMVKYEHGADAEWSESQMYLGLAMYVHDWPERGRR